MYFRTVIFVAALSTLCLFSPSFAAKVSEEAKPTILSCSIKSLGEGEEKNKSFTVKDKKGSLKVELVESSIIENHAISSIKDLDSGTTIHVLARKQEEQFGAGGARYPPMLVQVQVIVAGSFKPPAVPSKLRGQGFSWISGAISSVENGREREVADHRLTTSLGTEVLVIERKNATALKKRQKLFLTGYLDDSDRKNRKLEAYEIIILQSRWKKYDQTHDLKNRKPPIKKVGEDDPEDDEELPF